MNRFATALVLAALAFGFAQAEEPKACCKDKAACGKECKPGKEGAKHAMHAKECAKECAKDGKHAKDCKMDAKDCAKDCAKDGKHAKDCPQAPAAAKEKAKS